MIVIKYGARKPEVVGGTFEDLLEYLKASTVYYNDCIQAARLRYAAEYVCYELNEDMRDEIKEAYLKERRDINNKHSSSLGWGQRRAEDFKVSAAMRTRLKDERLAHEALARRDAKDLPPISFIRRIFRTVRPKYRHHDGTGVFAATIQGSDKVTTTSIMAGLSDKVRIDGTGVKRVATLRLKEGLSIKVPIMYHRALPPDAKVTAARLNIDRIGDRWICSVQFECTAMATGVKPVGSGTCAVNFGWRKVPTGVRVAYAVGDDGVEHECIMPQKLVDRFMHSEGMRSLGDAQAVAFLGDAKGRTKARVAALAQATEEGRALARIRITAEAPAQNAEHWARRDRHLYQWERDEYTHAMRSRRAVYLTWAQELARSYAVVRIETFNFTSVISRLDGEPKIAASHYRFLAAPSYLRLSVQQVFGDAVVVLPKAKHTVTCSSCFEECCWDKKKELRHTCEYCGVEWDQDQNNAKNQLVAEAAE